MKIDLYTLSKLTDEHRELMQMLGIKSDSINAEAHLATHEILQAGMRTMDLQAAITMLYPTFQLQIINPGGANSEAFLIQC